MGSSTPSAGRPFRWAHRAIRTPATNCRTISTLPRPPASIAAAWLADRAPSASIRSRWPSPTMSIPTPSPTFLKPAAYTPSATRSTTTAGSPAGAPISPPGRARTRSSGTGPPGPIWARLRQDPRTPAESTPTATWSAFPATPATPRTAFYCQYNGTGWNAMVNLGLAAGNTTGLAWASTTTARSSATRPAPAPQAYLWGPDRRFGGAALESRGESRRLDPPARPGR